MLTDGRTDRECGIQVQWDSLQVQQKRRPTGSITVKFKKIALSNIIPLEKDKYYVNVAIWVI